MRRFRITEGRDDISKLPLSAAAKAYARRKGLKSMMRQPADFLKVNADLTNPGRRDHFQNYTVAASPEKAFKESAVDHAAYIAARLLD